MCVNIEFPTPECDGYERPLLIRGTFCKRPVYSSYIYSLKEAKVTARVKSNAVIVTNNNSIQITTDVHAYIQVLEKETTWHLTPINEHKTLHGETAQAVELGRFWRENPDEPSHGHINFYAHARNFLFVKTSKTDTETPQGGGAQAKHEALVHLLCRGLDPQYPVSQSIEQPSGERTFLYKIEPITIS